MKKILVVVDMQNDFIDGVLGTPEAVAIVDNVVEKIRETSLDDEIFVTMDSHSEDKYLNSNEGKHLPVGHCFYGTDGWRLNSKIEEALRETTYIYDPHPQYHLVTKDTFGSTKLVDEIKNIQFYRHAEITLVGVCTDICVISNALLLKTHFPEARIVVDASCCAGSTPEKHGAALKVMESCQIDILNEVSGDQIDILEDYTRCDLCPYAIQCGNEQWDVCKKED